jgi:hypothetical protein
MGVGWRILASRNGYTKGARGKKNVTRAEKERTLRPIFKDDTLQTLYIGEGDLQLRIYDKWEEIKNSAKIFFLDVWAKGNGGRYLTPDEVTAVCRVEGATPPRGAQGIRDSIAGGSVRQARGTLDVHHRLGVTAFAR